MPLSQAKRSKRPQCHGSNRRPDADRPNLVRPSIDRPCANPMKSTSGAASPSSRSSSITSRAISSSDFSYRNLSLSDSAELFVLLAGWSMRLIDREPEARRCSNGGRHRSTSSGAAPSPSMSRRRSSRRLAIFILAAASVLARRAVPARLAQCRRRLPSSPSRRISASCLLTHQLGYFNILPLYVVLMVGGAGRSP